MDAPKDAPKTNQKKKRQAKIKPSANIQLDFFNVIPNGNGLEVKAQIMLNGLGDFLGLDRGTFKVDLTKPPARTLPPEKIEQQIREEMQRRLLPTLKTAFNAALTESVAAVSRKEPKETRETILKIHEKGFNQRNQIYGNGKEEPTMKRVFDDIIEGWKRIEKKEGKKIERPSLRKLAVELDCHYTTVSDWITKFGTALQVDDSTPPKERFWNAVRTTKEELEITDKRKAALGKRMKKLRNNGK